MSGRQEQWYDLVDSEAWSDVDEDAKEAEWDVDYQSQFTPLSVQQELITEAKHTWQNLSPTAVKEGLTSVATIAAREATARMPDSALQYATKAKEYVNQNGYAATAKDLAAIAARGAAAHMPDAAVGYANMAKRYVTGKGEAPLQKGYQNFMRAPGSRGVGAPKIAMEFRGHMESMVIEEPQDTRFTKAEQAVLEESESEDGGGREGGRRRRRKKGVVCENGGNEMEYDQKLRVRKQHIREKWLQKEEKPNRLLERIGGEEALKAGTQRERDERDENEERANGLLDDLEDALEDNSTLVRASAYARGDEHQRYVKQREWMKRA